MKWVFLVEDDSLESYFIAGRLLWAEFVLPSPFTAPSPLDPLNKQEARLYQPVGDVVHSTAAYRSPSRG